MKLSNAFLFATCVFMAEASDPVITAAVAKRSDSCVTLPDGPTDTGLDSSLTITVPTSTTGSPAPTITCEHEADPDGAQGLCPNLSNYGWCDCGDAGTYDMLAGDDPCGYTVVPPSGSISLTSTNCVSSEAIQTLGSVQTVTVVPIPASTTTT